MPRAAPPQRRRPMGARRRWCLGHEVRAVRPQRGTPAARSALPQVRQHQCVERGPPRHGCRGLLARTARRERVASADTVKEPRPRPGAMRRCSAVFVERPPGKLWRRLQTTWAAWKTSAKSVSGEAVWSNRELVASLNISGHLELVEYRHDKQVELSPGEPAGLARHMDRPDRGSRPPPPIPVTTPES
jgi:hypothetical protein